MPLNQSAMQEQVRDKRDIWKFQKETPGVWYFVIPPNCRQQTPADVEIIPIQRINKALERLLILFRDWHEIVVLNGRSALVGWDRMTNCLLKRSQR
jgi:hypothetical protein